MAEKFRLTVHVPKARNLTSADWNGFSDPYVLLYVSDANQSQRTETIETNLNPGTKASGQRSAPASPSRPLARACPLCAFHLCLRCYRMEEGGVCIRQCHGSGRPVGSDVG